MVVSQSTLPMTIAALHMVLSSRGSKHPLLSSCSREAGQVFDGDLMGM